MNLTALAPTTRAVLTRLLSNVRRPAALAGSIRPGRLGLDRLSHEWLSPLNLPLDRPRAPYLALDRFSPDHLPFERPRLPHLALPRRHRSAWQRLFGGAPVGTLLGAALAGALVGAGLAWLTMRRSPSGGQAHPLPESEIRAAWPELTSDDLERSGGDLDQLADTIGSRTGENTGSVRAVLHGMAARHAHANGQSASP